MQNITSIAHKSCCITLCHCISFVSLYVLCVAHHHYAPLFYMQFHHYALLFFHALYLSPITTKSSIPGRIVTNVYWWTNKYIHWSTMLSIYPPSLRNHPFLDELSLMSTGGLTNTSTGVPCSLFIPHHYEIIHSWMNCH